MKCSELLEEYFAACLFKKKKRTQETEIGCARRLNEFFGDRNVMDIKGQDVVDYRDSRDVGPRRISRELSVASAACNWAISDLGLDITNPFQGRLMSKNDRQGLPPPRKRSLTQAELSSLILISDQPLKDIITFAVNTGMRQAEILELTWDRVRDGMVWMTPDTQKSNSFGARALNWTATDVVKRQNKHHERVFTQAGKPIRRGDLAIWFQDAVKKAGLKDVMFHDLRRTCGTMMLDSGASMEEVKTQLGHADIRTTQNNYASDSIERARQAVLRMDRRKHA